MNVIGEVIGVGLALVTIGIVAVWLMYLLLWSYKSAYGRVAGRHGRHERQKAVRRH